LTIKRTVTVSFAFCIFSIHALLRKVYGSECLSTTKYVEYDFKIPINIDLVMGKEAADARATDHKKAVERRRLDAEFNRRLVENTRTKIGDYEIYVASLSGHGLWSRVVPDKSLSLVLEIKNATTNKILESARSLTRSSCEGEGKLAACFTFPIWLVSDSYGNKLKASGALTGLTDQLSPYQCDRASGSYSITPLQDADLIINIPSSVFGITGKLVVPKELVNEWFHSTSK